MSAEQVQIEAEIGLEDIPSGEGPELRKTETVKEEEKAVQNPANVYYVVNIVREALEAIELADLREASKVRELIAGSPDDVTITSHRVIPTRSRQARPRSY